MATRKIFLGLVLVAITSVLVASEALARGGAAGGRPPGVERPPIPGRSGASGGALLEERRARKAWLREKGATNPPSASRTRPTTPRPTPAPRRGGNGRTEPSMPGPTADTSLVHLHHGRVRMVGGLARVDLTLEVQNVGPEVMEWRRTYAIDASAEVIGAVLLRRNELPIRARTLTTFDAFRCYARIRTPPPTRSAPPRRPRRPRDPLLVSRPQQDRLDVHVWPIAPQETIRVELTFVTPLRGHGARRTYVDVMGGPTRSSGQTPRVTRPDVAEERPRGPGSMIDHNADWLMHPGELILSTTPAEGMTFGGEAGGQLRFTGVAAVTSSQPAPSVPFLKPTRDDEALLVGSGSFAGRIATFRFDPREYLARKGFVLDAGLTARLKAVRGSTRRLAPNMFRAEAEPRPVSVQVVDRTAKDIRFRVEVLGRNGDVIVDLAETRPLRTEKLDAELQSAVSGWHRAQLARRVFQSAGSDATQREAALRYAVDLGVLVPGSAALAIPANERARLTAQLRRLYETDGVPLGAPRHEADLKQPPRGSLDD